VCDFIAAMAVSAAFPDLIVVSFHSFADTVAMSSFAAVFAAASPTSRMFADA
jgi:hypothetical protein